MKIGRGDHNQPRTRSHGLALTGFALAGASSAMRRSTAADKSGNGLVGTERSTLLISASAPANSAASEVWTGGRGSSPSSIWCNRSFIGPWVVKTEKRQAGACLYEIDEREGSERHIDGGRVLLP